MLAVATKTQVRGQRQKKKTVFFLEKYLVGCPNDKFSKSYKYRQSLSYSFNVRFLSKPKSPAKKNILNISGVIHGSQ